MVSPILQLTLFAFAVSCSGVSSYTAIEKNSRSALDGSKTVIQDQLEIKLERLSIENIDGPIPIGVTKELKLIGLFSDSSKKDVAAIAKWNVSQDKVAEIKSLDSDRVGIVGSSAATVEITASIGEVSVSKDITFYPAKLERLQIAPADSELPVGGDGLQYKATGFFDDGNSYDVTNDAKWESSAPATADISAKGKPNGFLRGIVKGTVNIKASIKEVKASDAVHRVLEPVPVILSMSCTYEMPQFRACVAAGTAVPECVAESNVPMFVGRKAAIKTYAYFSDCKSRPVTPTKLISSNPVVATVADAQNIDIKAAGNSNISAQLKVGGATLESDKKVITGTEIFLVGIRFSGQNFMNVPSYCNPGAVGSPNAAYSRNASGIQFNLLGYFNDCREAPVTAFADWTSSDNGIGKFDNATKGFLGYEGKSGQVTAKAKINTLEATFSVEVNHCDGGSQSGLLALVYDLPSGTNSLPDMSKMTPIGRGYVKRVNLGQGEKLRGVNGKETYYGLRLIGSVDASSTIYPTVLSDDGFRLTIGGAELCSYTGTRSYFTGGGAACNSFSAGKKSFEFSWFQANGDVGIGVFGIAESWISYKIEDAATCNLKNFGEISVD